MLWITENNNWMRFPVFCCRYRLTVVTSKIRIRLRPDIRCRVSESGIRLKINIRPSLDWDIQKWICGRFLIYSAYLQEVKNMSNLRAACYFWRILHLSLFGFASTTSCSLNITFSLSTRHYAPRHRPQTQALDYKNHITTRMAYTVQRPNKVKVKFSHTRYWALGPELIPVYRQSVHKWLFQSHLPGGKPILLFARTDYDHLTSIKLYYLVTEAHRCEQLAQGCCTALSRWELKPWPTDCKSNALLLCHNPIPMQELLQLLDLVCGTLYWSNRTVQT